MSAARAAVRRVPLRVVRRTPLFLAQPVMLRDATMRDAVVIHGLIADHLAEGHLLPRDLNEIGGHAHRFIVAVQGEAVVGCAELAPLSSTVAEVRSFVVSSEARRLGIGRRLVDALVARATHVGFQRLCAFAHAPAYFVHLGFSLVPHTWLPEKIATDCHSCSHFRRCGQYAVMRTLVNHG